MVTNEEYSQANPYEFRQHQRLYAIFGIHGITQVYENMQYWKQRATLNNRCEHYFTRGALQLSRGAQMGLLLVQECHPGAGHGNSA